MDPTATLNSILSNLASDNPDRDIILNDLQSLYLWLSKDGYLPLVSKNVVSVADTNPLYYGHTQIICPTTAYIIG